MHLRLAFVALAILLLPAAAAQEPPEESLTVETSDGKNTYIVSRDEQQSFQVVVEYESQNPFDSQMARPVQMDVTSQLPAGWSVTFDPQSFEMMTTDDTAREVVTVTVTLGANADVSEHDLTIRAAMGERGAQDIPVVGGELDPERSASATVTLQRDDPVTRELLEGLGAWVWLVLAAVAALIVALAVLLARNNRTAVRLHSDVTEANVVPGKSVAVPLTVENLTNVEDTVVFHVAPMPEGWAAHLPVPDLELDGKAREELHLIVSSPQDASPGTRLPVGISAHSAQAPRKVAELVVGVHVTDTAAAAAATRGKDEG